jgi:RNA polymerase sigma-70 factor (ECF subfamily)
LTRAFGQIKTFRPEQSFGAWLRGFGLNLCRNYLRLRQRRAKPAPPEILAPAPAAEGQRQGVLSGILRGELRECLWQAVGELPLAYREALVMHYIDGLEYSEISEITGVSAGALRVRTLRARAMLKERLGGVVDSWLRDADETEEPQDAK